MKTTKLLSASLALFGAFFIACEPALAQWQVPNYAVPIGRGAGTGFKSAAPGTAGGVLASTGASSDPAFTYHLQFNDPATTIPFPSFDESNPSFIVGMGITGTFTDTTNTNGTFAAQTIIQAGTPYGEAGGLTGGLANKSANYAGSGVLAFLDNWSTATQPKGQALFAVLRGEKAKSAEDWDGVRGISIVSETVDPLGGPKHGMLIYNNDATNAFDYGVLVAGANLGGVVVGYGLANPQNVVPTRAFGLLDTGTSNYLFEVTGATGAVLSSSTITAGTGFNLTGASANPILTLATGNNYTSLNDPLNGFPGLAIGSSAVGSANFYEADTHTFRNRLGSVSFATIGSSGLGVVGSSSGTATIAAQAAAGTPTLTLPNASGTFAVSATSPLVLNATTGALTCPTCNVSSATVTSVSFTGGLISVATATTTPAFTVAGTSGGIPYFSSASTWASSAALAANALVIGGGAGAAPSSTTTGTGVLTALGVNTGTAGAFVVNGGALGTPSSGTVTNLTGTASININGTVGATTPAAVTGTNITATGSVIVGSNGTYAAGAFYSDSNWGMIIRAKQASPGVADFSLHDAADVTLLNLARGHVYWGTTTPSVSSCGTTPAIAGTDVSGRVTMGTGSPTGCTITFAIAYTSAPSCTVSWRSNLASMQYTTSTTAITLTQTGTSSNVVDYICHSTTINN